MSIIITENHPKWSLYAQLRKCGEITASTDGRHFGLNCTYCYAIFPWINIKEFLEHQHEKHASALFAAARRKRRQQEKFNCKKRKVSTTSSSSSSASFLSDYTDSPTLIASTESEDDSLDATDSTDGFTDIIKREEHLDAEYIEEQVYELVIETVEPKPIEKDYMECNDLKTKEITSKMDTQSSSEDDNDDEYQEVPEENTTDHKLDFLANENREVLSFIIRVHKDNPILWDKEHKFSQMFYKKIKIYNKMTKAIETRFKLKLSYMSIREGFADLRKLYREQLLQSIKEEQLLQSIQEEQQLQNIEDDRHTENTEIEKTPPSLWCFEQLEFLRKTELAENATVVLPIEQLMPLAEIYKRYPALWDLDCDDNHNRVRKVEAQHKMLQEINNANASAKMTLKQMRARITRLRKFYIASKLQRLECESNNETFQPDHGIFYEQLQFLEPFIGPYHCEKCNETEILTYYAYQKHMAAHEGRFPYVCRYCDKDFKLYANMETHMRRHTGEKPYVCTWSECGMSFAALTDLKLHRTKHTGEVKFVCHLCGAAFGTASHLRNHKIRTHVNKNNLEEVKQTGLLRKSLEIIDNEVYISFESCP